MTLEQNIMAVLESNFSESKDEIKERVLKMILDLIENANEYKSTNQDGEVNGMDEVEEYLKFECRRCAEARGKEGQIICHLDGKQKADTDTCSYWREFQQ